MGGNFFPDCELVPMSRNRRDLFELFGLPALVAALPWRFGTRLCRRLAARRLYAAETEAARQAASGVLPGADDDWARRYRLSRLFDHADLFLMLTRGRRWLNDWLDVEGAWPERGPFVVVTFHYGSGFWSIRHLRRAGFIVQAVRRGFDRALFGPAWALYWYIRIRTWVTDRAFGLPTLPDDAHSLRRMRQALRQGRCILGLFDVPVEAGRRAVEAEFFGRPARFPFGLVYLARLEAVPIVVYTVTTDAASGRKHLRIFPPITVADEQQAGREVVAHLEAAIRAKPSEWHHWPGISAFFAAAEAAGTPLPSEVL